MGGSLPQADPAAQRPAPAPPPSGPPTAVPSPPAGAAPALPGEPFMINIPQRPKTNEGQLLGRTIVGSMGLTGAMVIGALAIGAVLASGWILWRRWRRTYDVDAPPTLGPMPAGPLPADRGSASAPPPSSPDR